MTTHSVVRLLTIWVVAAIWCAIEAIAVSVYLVKENWKKANESLTTIVDIIAFSIILSFLTETVQCGD